MSITTKEEVISIIKGTPLEERIKDAPPSIYENITYQLNVHQRMFFADIAQEKTRRKALYILIKSEIEIEGY